MTLDLNADFRVLLPSIGVEITLNSLLSVTRYPHVLKDTSQYSNIPDTSTSLHDDLWMGYNYV